MKPATARSLATLVPIFCGALLLVVTPSPFLDIGLLIAVIAVIILMFRDPSPLIAAAMTSLRITIIAGVIALAYFLGPKDDDASTGLKRGNYTLAELQRTMEFGRVSISLMSEQVVARTVSIERNDMSPREITEALNIQLGRKVRLMRECGNGWTLLRGYDSSIIIEVW